ncbi:acetolactate synthase small subunit [Desulfovibrio psychrotolerans]|uniref:Acetolactate synthase small subunit n=1 Tax=Desulfovibrio psychrotolerans TaxID=415242 RepID=A0A7J0BT92_9BACT|nr:acetolactate synthase small subunit [Desulfovibrio psychrotolerans]GFM36936.1 acetolactate synthase small subunit [Desulfovibrio psychrotolerans]
MKHTISALVKNRFGAVAEVTDVFRRHRVNFKSISCAETEEFDVSRLVITVENHDDQIGAVLEELKTLDSIAELDDLSRKEFVDREMALIKVGFTRESMAQVMQIFEVFRANVVGMGQETISVEITGDEDKVDGLIKMLRPHGIRSLCRTGVVALKRGDE